MAEDKIKLDKKDRKLLYELDINARETTSKLGKKIGLSQQAVSYRINKYLEKGLIRHFNTVIDVAKLGYTFYKVYFKLQNITGEVEKKIVDFLVNHKNTFWVGTCSGNWDLSISVLAENITNLEKILEDINSKFVKYILDKEILVVSRIPHFSKKYLLNKNYEKSSMELGGEAGEIDIDKEDHKILSTLSTKGRAPLLDVADETDLSLNKVRYRIRQLKKKNIIQGFRAWIDLDLLGYKFYKVLVNLQDYDRKKLNQLISFCRRHENISYLLKTLGRWDLELEFEVKTIEDFHNSMIELRNRFQDIIKEYQSLLVFREHKLDYYPFSE